MKKRGGGGEAREREGPWKGGTREDPLEVGGGEGGARFWKGGAEARVVEV